MLQNGLKAENLLYLISVGVGFLRRRVSLHECRVGPCRGLVLFSARTPASLMFYLDQTLQVWE